MLSFTVKIIQLNIAPDSDLTVLMTHDILYVTVLVNLREGQRDRFVSCEAEYS